MKEESFLPVGRSACWRGELSGQRACFRALDENAATCLQKLDWRETCTDGQRLCSALASLRGTSAWYGWGLGGEAWVSEIRPREGARGWLCGNRLKRLESDATALQRRKPGQHQRPGTTVRGGAEPIAAAFLRQQNRSAVQSLPLPAAAPGLQEPS